MVRSVAVPAQQVVARRQQQHDSSGLQRSFGGKLMRCTRRQAGSVGGAELGCEEEGGQDGGEERQPGVLSRAVDEGLLVGI